VKKLKEVYPIKMADLANTASTIKKLNGHNYNYSRPALSPIYKDKTSRRSLEVVRLHHPKKQVMRKWKIKVGKPIFVLKTTIEDLLKYICNVDNPKMAWDAFVALFSRLNDVRLQLLENQLSNIQQGDMTINQYFLKIKTLCRDIAQLDPNS